jgi:sialic acid synthase SpsE
MAEEISIGKRKIGGSNPCFVIAEAGANFRISEDPEENYKQAITLIDIAADAKADAVKFQVYRASKLYVKDSGCADYIGKKKDIYEIIGEMELPYEWLDKLKEHAEKKGLIFFACPFDPKSADELEKTGVNLYKIASYSITNFPLLKHIAEKGKPIIMSTGASDLKEISEAVQYIKKCGNEQIILMQCTAKYPAPLSTVNLKVIPTLIEKFNIPIGISDHSREPTVAPMGAVALGAKVVEKHFTTDNSLPGPDHGFAILPKELKEMVSMIRKMEEALGDGEKTVSSDEFELHGFARHFIYSIKPIKKGEKFSSDNINTLRSGKQSHGLDPKYYDRIIGRIAEKDIGEQVAITEEMVDIR